MQRVRAERQLMLISAGTQARRTAMREHAQRLVGLVDWSRLTKTLGSRRLLTVLGPRICELAQGDVSDDFGEAVEAALAFGRRQGALQQLISMQIMATLADAGVRSSPLKGPLLGEILYGDVGRRPSADIDLLVAPEQLHEAVEVVRDLGYRAPTDHVDGSGMPLLHFALAHTSDELPPVELHWRIHWYERRFASERLLPRVATAPGDHWRPVPSDELAALLLFYARDGFVDLRLAADVGAWWDVFAMRLTDGELARLLSDYQQLTHLLQVAVKVAERLVGIDAQCLSVASSLGLRDRLAVRLANPNPRVSVPQLYADIGVIDALLMPRGHFRAFVKRQVLPPREVLDERARTAQRRRTTPIGHGVRVLSRYMLTMARLLRTPETVQSR